MKNLITSKKKMITVNFFLPCISTICYVVIQANSIIFNHPFILLKYKIQLLICVHNLYNVILKIIFQYPRLV